MLEMKQAAALSWADDGQEDDSLQLKIVVLKNAFDASEFTGPHALTCNVAQLFGSSRADVQGQKLGT